MKKAMFIKFIFFMCMVSVVWGQQQKSFTLEDAMLAKKKGFTPSRISYRWVPGKALYSWVEGDKLFLGKVRGFSRKQVLDKEFIKRKFNNIEAFKNIKKLPAYRWLSSKEIILKAGGNYLLCSYPGFRVIRRVSVPKGVGNLKPSGDYSYVAGTVDNNIVLYGVDGKKIQVTDEKDRDLISGQSVSRNEFGISGGLFWSPSGDKLAFYRKNVKRVREYPIVDISSKPASLKPVKYPMAGLESEDVSIGIYDIKSGKTLWLKTDGKNGSGKEQYLTSITWSSKEDQLFVSHLNRGQNHLKMNLYKVGDGSFIKTLFEEKNSKFVEPEGGFIFLGANKREMVWLSKNDGYRKIKLYNNRGNFIKDLVSGDWDVTDFIGSDRSGKYIYYSSGEVSPLERHIYRVDVKSGRKVKLTKGEGFHYGKLSGDGRYILDTYSAVKVPCIQRVLRVDGRVVKTLNRSKNPFSNYKLGEIEIVKLKTEDGKTDLYGRLIKPVDFDPQKKYPVIIYVYGGPHSQLVKKSWLGGGRLWQFYMAQKGYIAFTLDNRGTAARGRDFENCIHRKLGILETSDQMQGVKYLKSLSFVDKTRIGVHGWSYGGFMTLNMMLRHPGVFKAGVAGGPVTDYRYYEVMYGERYMDTPKENPEGYKNSDLNIMAGKLKGRLMLIHGALDNVVVWQHSLKFLRESVKGGVLVDYLVYPKHPHNVRGKDRIHLMKHVTRYFEDHLHK